MALKKYTEEELKERRKVWSARYRKTHAEQRKAYNKKYLAAHPDLGKKATRKWKENNLEAARQADRELARKRRKSDPDLDRRNHLKKMYGITIERYDAMFNEQGGQCAICGRHQSEFSLRLNVDHDHITGEVRGLLCGNCNTALGLLKESTQNVQNMLVYLVNYRRS